MRSAPRRGFRRTLRHARLHRSSIHSFSLSKSSHAQQAINIETLRTVVDCKPQDRISCLRNSTDPFCMATQPYTNAVKRLTPVDRIPFGAMSFEEFATRFADRPVIFRGMADQWPAKSRWTKDFFHRHYGHDTVSVVSYRQFPSGSQPGKFIVSLADFLDALSTNTPRDTAPLYLQEWYAFVKHPELTDDYEPFLPHIFEDWLATFPRGWMLEPAQRTNLRFGMRGSKSPLHSDNLNAMAWLAVLKGWKRFLLFSGRALNTDEFYAARAAIGAAPYFLDMSGINPELNRIHPAFSDAELWVADVREGDVIHVPHKWFHQVENLEETLSVGRYYANAINWNDTCEYLRREISPSAEKIVCAVSGHSSRRTFFRYAGPRSLLESAGGVALGRALRHWTVTRAYRRK